MATAWQNYNIGSWYLQKKEFDRKRRQDTLNNRSSPKLERRKERKKTIKRNIFLALFFFTMSLGIIAIISYVILSSKVECIAVEFNGEMTFEDLKFQEKLNDPTSEEFGTFERWFCRDFSKGMEQLNSGECSRHVGSCYVKQMITGSVTFRYSWSEFVEKNVMTKLDKVKLENEMMKKVHKAAKDGEKDMNEDNIFRRKPSRFQISFSKLRDAIQCDPVSIPENGYIFKGMNESLLVGDKVTVRCKPGFRFPSKRKDKIITCLESGKHDVTPSQCIENPCEDMDRFFPENAKLMNGSLTNNYFGDSIEVQCNVGYSFDPRDPNDTEKTFFCEENGTWDLPLSLDCKAVVCPDQQEPPNAVIEDGSLTRNIYKSSITIMCNEGYSLTPNDTSDNNQTITCGSTGNFDATLRTCEAVSCPDQSIPTHAFVQEGSLTGNVYNSRITFECDQGYSFTPSDASDNTRTIACDASGQFDANPGICQIVTCEDQEKPSNSVLEDGMLTGNIWNSSITFKCGEGLSFNAYDASYNSLTITCDSNGQFQKTPTACVEIRCLDQSLIPNAKLIDGSLKGNLVNSTITYECEEGYSLSPTDPSDNTQTIRCELSGHFEPSPMTCLVVQCGDLDLNNGELTSGSLRGNVWKSSTTYVCDEGYTYDQNDATDNSRTFTCGSDGQYNPSVITCLGVPCPDPRRPETATVTSGSERGNVYLSSVTFTCLEGYSFNPSDPSDTTRTITCGADGQFSPSYGTCSFPGCGGVLASESGYFTSPNYPSDYSNNELCEWIIQVSEGKVVQLQFEDFFMEYEYDYVAVSGEGFLDGYQIPVIDKSSSNRVIVIFRSDHINPWRGFAASFAEVEP